MAVEKFSTVSCFSQNFQAAVTWKMHRKSQTQERGKTNGPHSTLLLSTLLLLKYISDCKEYICASTKKIGIHLYPLKFIYSSYFIFCVIPISIATSSYHGIRTRVQFRHNCLYWVSSKLLISHGEILTNVRPIGYTITRPTEGRSKYRTPIGQGKCRTPCIRVDPFIGFIGSKVYTEERP